VSASVVANTLQSPGRRRWNERSPPIPHGRGATDFCVSGCEIPEEIQEPGAMRDYYSITELTREFDISTRTLRFYEDEGLIHPIRRGRTRLFRPSCLSSAMPRGG
jgi:hypothetical protein